MSRYIEKKYKLNSGEEITFYYDENRIGKVTVEAMDALIERLNNSVEVVRCKDCRHALRNVFKRDNDVVICDMHGIYRKIDGYCSDGERAEA